MLILARTINVSSPMHRYQVINTTLKEPGAAEKEKATCVVDAGGLLRQELSTR
jgi:hypothetical protein